MCCPFNVHSVLISECILLQAVSCYRSDGSLPIPTPAKPVVKKWIKLNKYKEDDEHIELEDHDSLPTATLFH